MPARHISLSRSVIVGVLRAIVLRPISTCAQPIRGNPRPSLIFTWKHTNVNRGLFNHCHRTYSSHATPSFIQEQGQQQTPDVPSTSEQPAEVTVLKKKTPRIVREYNKKIMKAVSESRLNKAIKLLRAMENNNIKPDVTSYTIIINGFCDQGDMIRAKRYFRRMLANGIKPDTYVYTSLINGYMREANIDRAEAMFRTMMQYGIKPTIVTYNILMHHSVRQLNMDSALKFWTNLLEAGLQSDVYTFAIVLHGLGDEGQVDDAWRIFKRMQQENVKPNPVVATTLMSMHVKQHDNQYAIDLYRQFFADKDFQPTPHTRNVLLNAVVGNADLKTIHKYYEQYKQHVEQTDSTTAPIFFSGPNVFAYTTFMRAFLRRDDLSMVSQVYQDMVNRKVQPSLVSYATLMLAHAYVPDPESCMRIFNQLKSSGVQLNAIIYTIVMRAWAKAGRWEQVRQTYEMMKTDNIKPTKMTLEVLRYGRSKA
ncbi:hypothetical protein BD560DRAFT_390330 [Blakeslea trispora]|nr:hypothetical protein BD560DRAFT_390330 [Blakeslea trispora]